jgi:NADPH2:quinone reductase
VDSSRRLLEAFIGDAAKMFRAYRIVHYVIANTPPHRRPRARLTPRSVRAGESMGTPARTKAIRVAAPGGPQVMQWTEVELLPPGPGQVRIRHEAVAVNFRDVLVRRGQYKTAMPTGLGTEGAGTIEALGPDVIGFALGDRVVCYTRPDDAYAEARNVPAARVIPLPDGIATQTAAAMMVRGMTARYLLKQTYAVRPGDAIVVHAAAGGVGLILCQWAKHLGATVIGTVGSDAKAAVARANGCDHVIVYPREDFAARVRELTDGNGVPVVYDSIGRDTFEASLNCLALRGVMASYGEASGDPPLIQPRRLGDLGSIFLTHPRLPDYVATRAQLLETANDLFDAVLKGIVRIAITRSYPLREAAAAHRDLESRATTGSIVLEV